MEWTALLLLVVAWMVAAGSPGPATLAISGTSMEHGRAAGLTIATGIVTGSALWGISAALGVGAIMIANAWLFELIRYFGAAYLMYLALKSARNALTSVHRPIPVAHRQRLYWKGLLLHLTNPKAVLSWGSIYSIALPAGAEPWLVAELFLALITASMTVFLGYAILFSNAAIARAYVKLRRWFEAVFALLFGAASLKILTTRLEVSS